MVKVGNVIIVCYVLLYINFGFKLFVYKLWSLMTFQLRIDFKYASGLLSYGIVSNKYLLVLLKIIYVTKFCFLNHYSASLDFKNR